MGKQADEVQVIYEGRECVLRVYDSGMVRLHWADDGKIARSWNIGGQQEIFASKGGYSRSANNEDKQEARIDALLEYYGKTRDDAPVVEACRMVIEGKSSASVHALKWLQKESGVEPPEEEKGKRTPIQVDENLLGRLAEALAGRGK